MMLIFICLALVWLFVQYFEKKRQDRLEEQHERRAEVYDRLLETLKNREVNEAENNKAKD